MMFSGLMSACTMPARWAATRAAAHCVPRSRKVSRVHGSRQTLTQRFSFDKLHDEKDLFPFVKDVRIWRRRGGR